MEQKKLIVGMPAGSLATPGRGGNLIQLLEAAGFKTSGYDSGGPSKFSAFSCYVGWDGRPQEFATQLGLHEIDVAIGGDDWMRERILELKYEYNINLELQRVLSLKRGGVRIVGIINQADTANTTAEFLTRLTSKQKTITVVSEMPYLALNWIKTKLKEIGKEKEFSAFTVQKYKTPPKIKEGIIIYETWGKTEAKVKNGGADLGLEITQSGSALKSYELKIIETVMESETGIYINPAIKTDNEKLNLLKMFLLNLFGAVNAENKVMIVFNVPNNVSSQVEKYLTDNGLFGDEPTINRGKEYTEYSIQVDIADKKLPLARIRFDLAMLHARHIDTIPINSSIPGMDVLVGI